MSPAARTRVQVFMETVRYFCLILNILVSPQKFPISNSKEIRLMGAVLTPEHRRTDRPRLIYTFSDYAKVLKGVT